jgi:hypothetical protein
VVIVDSKTISLPEFNYDGLGEGEQIYKLIDSFQLTYLFYFFRKLDTYFWVGVGPQPSVKGFKVPDEKG